MSRCLAVVNAGSSSVKCAVFDIDGDEAVLVRGQVEQIGVSPKLCLKDAHGAVVAERSWPNHRLDHRGATLEILQAARSHIGERTVVAVGHRVVHGGTRFTSPIRIDPGVIRTLRGLVPLAPLHQPHNLVAIEAIAEAAPRIPQVACFDTAFHGRQPPVAQMLGLPRRFFDDGVRRYGFHGLSYEYVSARLFELAPSLAKQRVIVAHLGNGASLCGMRAGRSIATSMGFTAVDGLLMGTRCGGLDAGVMLHLMDAYNLDARAIEDLIYRRSGLLGVSGISADMRTLRASSEAAAAQAVALFVYRVVREIGSIAAALGGVDGVVFTGGIGENDAAARAEIAEGCRWLGLELDPRRNAQGVGRISTDDSALAAWVVATDEERMIVLHSCAVLGLMQEHP